MQCAIVYYKVDEKRHGYYTQVIFFNHFVSNILGEVLFYGIHSVGYIFCYTYYCLSKLETLSQCFICFFFFYTSAFFFHCAATLLMPSLTKTSLGCHI